MCWPIFFFYFLQNNPKDKVSLIWVGAVSVCTFAHLLCSWLFLLLYYLLFACSSCCVFLLLSRTMQGSCVSVAGGGTYWKHDHFDHILNLLDIRGKLSFDVWRDFSIFRTWSVGRCLQRWDEGRMCDRLCIQWLGSGLDRDVWQVTGSLASLESCQHFLLDTICSQCFILVTVCTYATYLQVPWSNTILLKIIQFVGTRPPFLVLTVIVLGGGAAAAPNEEEKQKCSFSQLILSFCVTVVFSGPLLSTHRFTFPHLKPSRMKIEVECESS